MHTVILRAWRRIALLGLLLLPATLALAVPDFPAPPHAKLEWVSQNMVMNGIPTAVRLFQSKWKTDKVAEFYRREWEYLDKRKPGYTESEAMAPWHLITRVEEGYLMNVQYQEADSGGTWGYLSLSRLPAKDTKPDTGNMPPAMRSSVMMSNVETDDAGQSGRSAVLRNDFSASSNVDFYRSYYKRLGWGVQLDRGIDNRIHTLSYRNGRREVNIVVIGNHQESQVVYNEIVHDLL